MIACGGGTDTVKADSNDKVAADCENVKVSGKPMKPMKANGNDDDRGRSEDRRRDDDHNGRGPRFDEDGKPGMGPKEDSARVG